MRKTLFTMGSAAAMCALLSSPASARQYGPTDDPRGDAPTTPPRTMPDTPRDESQARPSSDKKFIEEAAANGVAEVKLAQLASQKASHEDVKEFAERLVQDHSRANTELEKIAAAQNVTVPQEPTSKHQKLYDRLSKLSGQEFDKEYVKHMVDDHEKAVKKFERQAKDASDPQLKQFASSTLPALEDHLAEAERLEREVSGDTPRATTGTRDSDSDRDQENQTPPTHNPEPEPRQ